MHASLPQPAITNFDDNSPKHTPQTATSKAATRNEHEPLLVVAKHGRMIYTQMLAAVHAVRSAGPPVHILQRAAATPLNDTCGAPWQGASLKYVRRRRLLTLQHAPPPQRCTPTPTHLLRLVRSIAQPTVCQHANIVPIMSPPRPRCSTPRYRQSRTWPQPQSLPGRIAARAYRSP